GPEGGTTGRAQGTEKQDTCSRTSPDVTDVTDCPKKKSAAIGPLHSRVVRPSTGGERTGRWASTDGRTPIELERQGAFYPVQCIVRRDGPRARAISTAFHDHRGPRDDCLVGLGRTPR